MSEIVSLNPRITPHKFLAYLSALAFGILCGPLPYHSPGIQQAFQNYDLWENVWSYLLLVSGLVCLVGVFIKAPLVGLPIEIGGLVGSFFGWLVYCLAIFTNNPSSPVTVLAVAFCLAAVWQALRARVELSHVSIADRLPTRSIIVPVLPESEGHHGGKLRKGDQ